MQDILSIQDKLLWFIVLVVLFPLLMIVLGELVEKLERRRQAFATPLAHLRNLVLPLAVFFLILTRLAGMERGSVLVRVIETALWVVLIYAALSLLNVVLFANAKPGGWQDKIPKLLVDLSRVFLVLVGSAIVLSNVWNIDLGGVLAALGVGSLVLGLALQDSLGNIFSGIAMLFEHPFSLDDWLEVGGTTGRVVEITWRSVYLETTAGDLVIVPNSEIAQGSFTNFSRPQPAFEKIVDVAFSYDDPPQKVIDLLKKTALETPDVIPSSVWVKLLSYGDFAINYQIGLSAPTMSQSIRMRNTFMMRLWYLAKRHNLTMPYPTATEVEYQSFAPTPEQQANRVKSILMTIPSLSRLSSKALDMVVKNGSILNYCAGETIIPLEERIEGLYFIVEGEVQLKAPDPALMAEQNGAAEQLILGHLSAGEFFGEQACLMTEQYSDFTAVAIKDVEVFILERQYLEEFLEQSPQLSQKIAEVMELRQRAVSQLMLSQVA